ncbi:MAG TPA: DUF1343 domain-containing protein [Candidatus Methylacidiphilales bacterium]|nr:DUF1343 domain-containing protein [Candidatus Methylacidiphilales bacterium]
MALFGGWLRTVWKIESMKARNSFSFFVWVCGLFLVLAWNARGAAVSLGIDELEKSHFAVLQGKRVGLITNPSGADSRGRSAIDVLYHGTGFHLVRLFGPEHGLYGTVQAGRSVEDSLDSRTGLRVCSLYGDTRRPTPEMLEGIDTLVYDVQDLGCRSYTFISTLGYVMEEAAKRNIEVVVLDRPNPLGGIRIEGPRLNESVKSFVGLYDIPYVYGLTPGELAEWINAKYLEKPCRLVVVAMRGWTRDMVWEDTGLKWIPTSPNIPTIGAARGYTATGFLGEIGIESGIGGPAPFQAVAGNGWDPAPLVRQFRNLNIPGVRVLPYRYRSDSDRWGESYYSGVYLQIDPRNAGNLTAISLQSIEILEREIDGFSAFGHTTADEREMFAKVTGQAGLRHDLIEGRPVSDIVRSWNAGVVRWAQERKPYLLYGNTPSSPSNSGGVIAGAVP